MANAILIVDVQNDFCEGGALAVPDANTIIEPINDEIMKYTFLVYTRDWHEGTHDNWPEHCIRYSRGAEHTPGLIVANSARALHICKEGYSAFSGTGLAGKLRERDVTDITITGLALDYCVLDTAIDALRLGFKVTIPMTMTRAVNEQWSAGIFEALRCLGARVL